MKDSIVLVGGGGHCKACIDVIEREGKYLIAGIVDKQKKRGTDLFGYPFMGTDTDLTELCKKKSWFFITVGQIKSSQPRYDLFQKVKDSGGDFPIIVSPNAYLSPHAVIGKGTIIMHNTLINAGAKIGKNSIVNSGAIIEHDAILGSHIHISTGAILNGGVKIGGHTFIGSRAVIMQGVTIGENVVISAGVSVFKDVPKATIVYGNSKKY